LPGTAKAAEANTSAAFRFYQQHARSKALASAPGWHRWTARGLVITPQILRSAAEHFRRSHAEAGELPVEV